METCKWKLGFEYADYYETSCGEAFQFTDGSPTENKMKFCPYCGKPLEEEPTKEES